MSVINFNYRKINAMIRHQCISLVDIIYMAHIGRFHRKKALESHILFSASEDKSALIFWYLKIKFDTKANFVREIPQSAKRSSNDLYRNFPLFSIIHAGTPPHSSYIQNRKIIAVTTKKDTELYV